MNTLITRKRFFIKWMDYLNMDLYVILLKFKLERLDILVEFLVLMAVAAKYRETYGIFLIKRLGYLIW